SLFSSGRVALYQRAVCLAEPCHRGGSSWWWRRSHRWRQVVSDQGFSVLSARPYGPRRRRADLVRPRVGFFLKVRLMWWRNREIPDWLTFTFSLAKRT